MSNQVVSSVVLWEMLKPRPDGSFYWVQDGVSAASLPEIDNYSRKVAYATVVFENVPPRYRPSVSDRLRARLQGTNKPMTVEDFALLDDVVALEASAGSK